jgi:hypothetical protein
VLDSLTHMSAGLTHSYECGGRRTEDGGGRRKLHSHKGVSTHMSAEDGGRRTEDGGGRRKLHSHKGVFHSLINKDKLLIWTLMQLHNANRTFVRKRLVICTCLCDNT